MSSPKNKSTELIDPDRTEPDIEPPNLHKTESPKRKNIKKRRAMETPPTYIEDEEKGVFIRPEDTIGENLEVVFNAETKKRKRGGKKRNKTYRKKTSRKKR